MAGRIEEVDQDQISFSGDNFGDQMSESTSEIDHAESEVDQNPSPYNLADFAANGFMERMVEGAEYEAISKRFTSGMGSLSKDINVVAIHKKLTSNITVQAKMNSFRIFTEAMARKCGGDANVKIACAISSPKDESGLRHILLCRVIMGRMEQVPQGSGQFLPSSNDQFDSGADNLVAPTRYVVWSAFMNTHLSPEFLISFTFPSIEGKQDR
ncbi:Poly(ADP-ribose) polymerase, catalytic domain containing protein [Trema orientale]|uniref:Poly(ADP-ribose) polymerase, catalytic domain containing protein n=1 Tax=Trema orientale TaxID=63057 RepID=A0A2P5FMF3_TREOI|nr:Poly(ADP-ribose) polymerase, catalytic domain containing protein [Trema orientale]